MCYRISSRVAGGFVVGLCWLSMLYIVVSLYMLIPNSQFLLLPQLVIWYSSAWLLCGCVLMFFGGGSLIVWSCPTFLFCFCCPCFWCHLHKITSKTNVYNFSRMFSSCWFIVSDRAFESIINAEFSFFMWYKVRVLFHSFAFRILVAHGS